VRRFTGSTRVKTTRTVEPEGKTATGKGWRGNLADQAIGRIEARLVLLLLSKIVIPVK